MAAITAIFASGLDVSTRSATFVNCCATSALSNGVDYLVLVTANANSDENDSTTEVEVRFGTTRYAFARSRAAFNSAPDAATGATIQTAFIVTGNGSNVVDVRFARLDGPGNTDHFCTAHVACVPLDSLTENTHYWQDQGTNSDSLTNPSAGSGWASISGSQLDVTPGSTGNFLIIGTMEGEFTSGHSASDQIRIRCRMTEDPTGTPTAYNLMRNTTASPDIDGPESQIEGGSSWGEYACSQRFVDVLSLTASTTYRWNMQYEGVSGTANTGYRRDRIIVFDLSAWPEFAFVRDVDAKQESAPGPATFGNVSVSAPSAARDYLLLTATAYQNNTTWMRGVFDTNPTGSASELPTSSGFGVQLIDLGTGTADDYCTVGAQWHRSSISAAQTIGTRWDHDNADTPFGCEHGVGPTTATDDGIATVIVAWGMDTSVSTTATGSGTAAGSSTATGTAEATSTGLGTAAGSSTAAATAEATSTGLGTAAGSSTATGDGLRMALGDGTAAGGSTADATAFADATGLGTAAGGSTGDGTAVADATGLGTAAGSATADGTAQATATGFGSADGTSTGDGTAVDAGGVTTGDGTAAGSSTATAAAGATAAGLGAAAGSSTADATAFADATGLGTAAGSSAATGDGLRLALGSGTAAGSSTGDGTAVDATGGATTGSGTAAGTSTATGTAEATATGLGTAAGSSVASAASEATATGLGTAAGSSTATGDGVRSAIGSGVAAAFATAAAVAVMVAAGDASAIGSSTADGTAQATATGLGTAAGTSAASGTATTAGLVDRLAISSIGAGPGYEPTAIDAGAGLEPTAIESGPGRAPTALVGVRIDD